MIDLLVLFLFEIVLLLLMYVFRHVFLLLMFLFPFRWKILRKRAILKRKEKNEYIMQKSFHLYVLPQREEACTLLAPRSVCLSLLVNSRPQGPACWRSTRYSGRKRKQIKIHHTERECKHLVSLTSSEMLPDSPSPMDLREEWYLETQNFRRTRDPNLDLVGF